ncbi:AMP-binding protein [Nocardioides sp. YIM 123512]|uniref:AMP-binding protein n=1 Tax=Nocardioides flavescens TaxID=2691959 RepID=A0A6L7EWG7_9ACTN|nr:AMP-binding protein [Nocardioides flavescens]MXG90156.1 AMP-binding protein [Nocardioides flavescens]
MRGTTAEVVAALGEWVVGTDDEPLLVETSGSTGRPKRVVLSRRAVHASVAATARRLGGEGRWLLALPAAYVAGAQVVCRSVLAGAEPVVLEGTPFAEAAARCDYVSLVPTQLLRMLEGRADDLDALRGMRTVLLGGGPVDPALRARAAELGVRVVATYGSAETAGGCVYDGVPLDGVAVATERDGRLRVSGPTLFDGYDGDPELTARVLVDGWFRTEDAARIDEDGRLQLLGRLDDVVVTGGVNVPAPAVARRLREHPAVREAEVLGVPDEEWGNRLVAFVVVDPAGYDLPLDEVRAWVAEAHPRSWAPRELVRLDAVPLLANGKTDRMALRRLAAGS